MTENDLKEYGISMLPGYADPINHRYARTNKNLRNLKGFSVDLSPGAKLDAF